MNRVSVVALWCLAGAVGLLAQDRDAPAKVPVATAVIGGRLVTGADGALQPLRRGVVTVTGTGIVGARQVVADDDGQFAVEGLAGGRYAVSASKPGYLTAYFGNRVSYLRPSTPIALAPGERRVDLQLFVARGAAIEGTVRDEWGQPLASAQVSARLLSPARGERRFVAASSGPAWVVTDDRGQFRLYGLVPGEYTVRAGVATMASILSAEEVEAARQQVTTGQRVTPRAPTVRRLAPAYYPDVTEELRASTVRLGLSEQVSGIDVTVRAVPMSSVSFVAGANSGAPLAALSIGVANLSTGQLWASRGGVIADPLTGRGRVPGLMPGRYLFFGSASEAADLDRVWYLSREVELGGADVVDLPLVFQPGVRVSGRVTASTSASTAMPVLNGVRVQLNAVSEIRGLALGATRSAPVDADGRFEVEGVAPGTYRLGLSGLEGWSLVSALSQGVDTLDSALNVGTSIDVADLDLRISPGESEVAGQVIDAQGRPASDLTVVAVPADRALWSSSRRLSGPAHVGTDGRYEIRGLPAGRYVLAVVGVVESDVLDDPAVLEQLAASGVVVDLAEGQHLTQHLKIGG